MGERGPGSVACRVSWRQATAFRLRRHHLAERADLGRLAEVVVDMDGARA
jgi:hypothetical protein